MNEMFFFFFVCVCVFHFHLAASFAAAAAAAAPFAASSLILFSYKTAGLFFKISSRTQDLVLLKGLLIRMRTWSPMSHCSRSS